MGHRCDMVVHAVVPQLVYNQEILPLRSSDLDQIGSYWII
jgi:hypothetical protein